MMSSTEQPSSPPSAGVLAASANPRASLGQSLDSQLFEKSILTSRRWIMVMMILSGSAMVAAFWCLQFGAQYVGVSEMLRMVVQAALGTDHPAASDPTTTILLHVRLPRVFLGFLVGSCLASVGVALQSLLRNPLADPYVLGVSSGAALGVAAAVLFGVGTSVLAVSTLPLCGLGGGLVALLVVYRMAATYDRLPIYSVLLAGVILNAIFSALIMFVTSIMDPNRSFGMMVWLMGSLTAPAYPALVVFSLYLIVGLGLLLRQMTVLNIMAFGEEPARSLGVDTARATRYIFVVSALITGAVVSVSGMIGFIGMVVPHAIRLIVGADHRLLLPASAVVGGTFLMVADTLARTVLSPSELPVGILTALAGGPFFIYLLVWRKDRMS
ncbi:MAG TPA: iron ABC transporter permease [Nitrospira sp.]|nr:iron ABC transporter permease [Nitrospira sp.]